MLISPAEPELLKLLGTVSSLPEQLGCDFLLDGRRGAVAGVQRKTISDLVASVNDGRFQKELLQMGKLNWAAFLIEGREEWTSDGVLVLAGRRREGGGRGFTLARYQSILLGIQSRGIRVLHSLDLADTTRRLQVLDRWWTNEHSGRDLEARPKVRGEWGDRMTDAEGLLAQIDGVGYKRAKAIVKHFNGEVPLKITCAFEELLRVEGIGRVTAEKIWRVVGRTA